MIPRLADRLRDARRTAGLDLDQLAARSGVGRRTLERWEAGAASPRLDLLAAVAGALGVTLRDLLTDGPIWMDRVTLGCLKK